MKVVVILSAMISHVWTQDSVGYTDESRPYKFGFNVEGYQHRSEEKDEKGIIKGEYGFVTGDGVYHVTVYATDENGNFRIISMKNYYIGLPNENTTPTTIMTNTPSTVQPFQLKLITIRKLDGIPGCGGCLIPTSTSRPTTSELDRVADIDIRIGNDVPSKSSTIPSLLSGNSITKGLGKSQVDVTTGHKSTSPSDKLVTTRTPFRGDQNEILPHDSKKPSSISTINSNEESDVKQLLDPSDILYEFNQTQTFQGHHEKGFQDGSKLGDYFVSGRDGVKQIVEYIADDSGYQPHVRFINISQSETPNVETEKSENVLKGLYFKWFYKK